jgi:predicted  nucleic acid-binding Zn-ribbon protein
LVIATLMLKLPPWGSMFASAAPLLWYHVGYLKPKAERGLSQAAIDSVYYFGFLVTIAALGVSAVSLAQSGGKEPIENIAYQFGLGLLATGYAVLARMHLASVAKAVDEASAEAVMDKYVQRSRELVMNVEMASVQFAEFSRTLMAMTKEAVESSRVSAEKSMLEVARVFDEQLRGTMVSANHGISELRGMMSEASFVHERGELSKSLKMTLEGTTQVNAALSDLASGLNASKQELADMSSSARTLSDSVKLLERAVGDLGSSDGVAMKASANMTNALDLIGTHSSQLATVMIDVTHIGESVSGVSATFKSIRSLSQKASEQMESLIRAVSQMGEAASIVERSNLAAEGLAKGLAQVSEVMPGLADRTQALDAQLTSLVGSVGGAQQSLSLAAQPTAEAVKVTGELSQALTQVQQILSSAGMEAKQLAMHTTDNAAALAQARQLSTDMETVRVASESIKDVLQGLMSSLASFNQKIGDSTSSLQTAVTRSATSIEQDVKRSTEAASLFGERMVDVAQIIIDRTRQEKAA